MRYMLLFFVFFLGHGVYFSALSPYAHSEFGKDAWIIFLAGQISFPFGYFLSGYISDRFRGLRNIITFCLLIHAPAQYLLFSFEHSLLITALMSALTRFLFAVNFQLITIAVIEGGGEEKFGRNRSFGTIGFFFIHFFLLIAESGYWPGLMPFFAANAGRAGRLGLVFHLLSAIVAFSIQKHRLSTHRYYFRDALRIIMQRRTLLFLLLSFFFFFSYQLVDYYLGKLLQSRGGLHWVYAGWCLAVVLEMPFLPLSAWLLRRYRLRSFFLISTLAGAIRFSWIALDIAGWAPISLLYSQLLHGIQFSGYYMGAIFLLRKIFPPHLFGTGSGVYIVVAASIGGMAGNLFYGQLLYSETFSSTFLGYFDPGSHSELMFLPLFASAAILQGIVFFWFSFSGVADIREQ